MSAIFTILIKLERFIIARDTYQNQIVTLSADVCFLNPLNNTKSDVSAAQKMILKLHEEETFELSDRS